MPAVGAAGDVAASTVAGRTDAAGFLGAMQAETDRLAADANVTKYSR